MTSPGRYPGFACLGSTAYNHLSKYCGDTHFFDETTAAYKTGWTADKLLIETTYFIFYR